MNCYPMAAMERTMKIQEVILRALAKKITWWQAAEIIGITDRQMRRWHWRYREYGYDGLLDHRLGKPSPKRVPLALVEQVFTLYRALVNKVVFDGGWVIGLPQNEIGTWR
jgi:hypothetical protein